MMLAVYKLGGSLLSLPDLAPRLQRLFEREADHPRRIVISGGGPTADIVREWDRLHRLGEERAHWLALESLRLNESLLAELLPNSRIVRDREEAERAWDGRKLAILRASDFVRSEETCTALRLPHTWDVTSDSIAAWVAAVWPADRLVLLKSVSLPDCGELPECESGGTLRGRRAMPAQLHVDPCFAEIAPHVAEVRWVNLRDDIYSMLR